MSFSFPQHACCWDTSRSCTEVFQNLKSAADATRQGSNFFQGFWTSPSKFRLGTTTIEKIRLLPCRILRAPEVLLSLWTTKARLSLFPELHGRSSHRPSHRRTTFLSRFSCAHMQFPAAILCGGCVLGTTGSLITSSSLSSLFSASFCVTN